ncbi:sulfite oxidase-like oxidoreductase [Terriglobus roseus DSM 18391]|uniref:Sulfite oxidase-like oxidoreductase n=1 Tax=Terriglobus roseus (strain DSM 18391 / NRRL B-41598 / KBS 63) TaxID=926566 RepID=I3ZDE5_TERRK|nr:molybdopterin-dependent oxidoreductase [Terriglobus roseus]AFL87263.1 sulfite oxidase-like oxidoreductase [Terriglobus roseus DSM 18391]
MIESSQSRTPEELDEEVRRILHARTRRSFLIGGAAALAGVGLYEVLYRAKAVNELQWPLREAHEANRSLTNALFGQRVLAPTYKASEVTGLRINGDFGIDTGLIESSWGLQLVGLDRPQQYRQFMPDVDLWEYRSKDDYQAPTESQEPDVKGKGPGSSKAPAAIPHMQESTGVTASADAVPGIVLRLEDLKKLPYTEQITQFKCVEGWSQIVRWGGVRFSDLLRAYPPANIDGGPPKFVTMETSNGEYNASFDMPSLMHPQTLLCYSMDGVPLQIAHGAPVRLAMPLKYGYKQIKSIASLTFSNVRTPDYWEKLGYDWYAGL